MVRLGQSLKETILHSNQDSVYTGYDWLQAILLDERFRYYNRRRRHAQIGNRSPLICLANMRAT